LPISVKAIHDCAIDATALTSSMFDQHVEPPQHRPQRCAAEQDRCAQERAHERLVWIGELRTPVPRSRTHLCPSFLSPDAAISRRNTIPSTYGRLRNQLVPRLGQNRQSYDRPERPSKG